MSTYIYSFSNNTHAELFVSLDKSTSTSFAGITYITLKEANFSFQCLRASPVIFFTIFVMRHKIKPIKAIVPWHFLEQRKPLQFSSCMQLALVYELLIQRVIYQHFRDIVTISSVALYPWFYHQLLFLTGDNHRNWKGIWRLLSFK